MVLSVKDLYRAVDKLLNDEDTLRLYEKLRSAWGDLFSGDLFECAVIVLNERCASSNDSCSMFKEKDNCRLNLYGEDGSICYSYIYKRFDTLCRPLSIPLTDVVLKEWELTECAEKYLKSILQGV